MAKDKHYVSWNSRTKLCHLQLGGICRPGFHLKGPFDTAQEAKEWIAKNCKNKKCG